MKKTEHMAELGNFLTGEHARLFTIKRSSNRDMVYLHLKHRTKENLGKIQREISARWGEPNEKIYMGKRYVKTHWGKIGIAAMIHPEIKPPDIAIHLNPGFATHLTPHLNRAAEERDRETAGGERTLSDLIGIKRVNR